jgi:uncharacterized protein YkwD
MTNSQHRRNSLAKSCGHQDIVKEVMDVIHDDEERASGMSSVSDNTRRLQFKCHGGSASEYGLRTGHHRAGGFSKSCLVKDKNRGLSISDHHPRYRKSKAALLEGESSRPRGLSKSNSGGELNELNADGTSVEGVDSGNKKYNIRRRIKRQSDVVVPKRSQILQHIDAQTMGNISPTTVSRRSRILQHIDDQTTASLLPITSQSDPEQSQGQEEIPALTSKKVAEASQCRAIPIRMITTRRDPSAGPSTSSRSRLPPKNTMTLPKHILANTDKATEGSLDDDSKTIQSCPPLQTKPRKKSVHFGGKHIMDVAKKACSHNALQDDLQTIKSCPVASSKELKRGTSLGSHIMANSSDAKCSLNDRPSRSGKTRSVLKLEVDVTRENFTDAGHYANNLVIVNCERAKVCVLPLTRSVTLDETASTFAKQMAKSSGSQQIHTHLSANMMLGPSVRAIHAAFMNRDRERDNILSADSKEFGMGTAKGEDGQIYLCQLFGGERVLLTCLDYK